MSNKAILQRGLYLIILNRCCNFCDVQTILVSFQTYNHIYCVYSFAVENTGLHYNHFKMYKKMGPNSCRDQQVLRLALNECLVLD